jgi:hypothetical protein
MATQTVSAADRIRELTDINSDVVAMLSSAGKAINALTNRPLDATSDDDNDTNMEDTRELATLDARKQAFLDNTKDFYDNLHAVAVRLRRQAYALEEAGIITPEATSISSISVKSAKPPPAKPSLIKPGVRGLHNKLSSRLSGSQTAAWASKTLGG